MNENKTKKPEVKKRRKRLKMGYVLTCIVIIFVIVVAIKLVIPSSKSKYGDRLDDIKKISYSEKDKNKLIKSMESNEKVTKASIDIKGKIVNIIFNVTKETSVDDARAIANDTLGIIPDEIKSHFDIQYMISKKDEEGEKKTVEKDGKTEEVTVTQFPKMGYKNTKSSGIVW